MKVKINKITGMVALVAGANIMNQKEGVVFGVLPKDAARLISQDAALPLGELPEGIKYDEVEINVESGQVMGLATGDRNKKSDPASGLTEAELQAKYAAAVASVNSDAQAKIDAAVTKANTDAQAKIDAANKEAAELLAEADKSIKAAEDELAVFKAEAAKAKK